MTQLLAPEAVVARVRRFYQVLQQAEPTDVREGLAEDAVLHNPVGFPPLQGRDRVMEFFDRLHRMVREFELQMEPLLIVPGGNEAAVRLAVTLTRDGERHQLERIDVIRLDAGGRIAEMRVYWDLPGALRELLS